MKKKDIYCPFCRAVNPASAYVCIKCFKVINSYYKPPFWKMQISSFSGTLIIFATAATAAIFFIAQWLDSVEGEIDVKVRTNEYNVSMAAEKSKKEFNIDISTDPAAASASTAPVTQK